MENSIKYDELKTYAESFVNDDKFRELIEGLNVITYEYNLGKRKFEYVSRMAESILGYPQSMWMESGFWYDHLHPEDRLWASEFSSYNTKLLHDHEYEYRMISGSGEVKWFKDITTVISDKGYPVTLRGVLIDMTERKETEYELIKSKEHYKTLVEQQSEMITRWKPDGTFTYVNDIYCRFFEKSRNELIGKTYIPQMPVEDLERFSRFLKQLDIDNPVGNFTHRVIKSDREIRWLRWTDTAIFDNSGKIVEYQSVGRDITARKKAEEALKESEQQLQLIFDNAPIGMVITDFYNNLLKVNKSYCDIVGYTKAELVNMTFEDITHPDDLELDKQVIHWAKRGEISNYRIEKRYLSRSGKIVFAEVHLNILRNSSGVPHQLIAQVIDITERKDSEQKLRLTQARLSAILNNLPNVAIYEYGENINFVSENIMDILGYPAEEFMKDEQLFSDLMYPEDIKKYDTNVANWKKDGASGVISNDIRVRNKNGDIVWLEDHMFEITTKEGKPYFSGIMIDITEQKKTQQRIQETETKLAAILKNLPKVVVYQAGNGKDFISENISDMIGYTSEDVLKEKFFFGNIIHPDDIKTVKASLKEWHNNNDEGILIMEFRLKKKSGDYIWIEDHMFKVYAEDGNSFLSGILIDITERKLAEQKISQSLREKELLLKEIHHRVKNNLQVVSSLLKLQSSYAKDKHSFNILLDSQNRVRSMALVHQKLYQSKDFSQIDFSEYLKQLSDHLLNVFKDHSNNVELEINSKCFNLSIDLAIPCGLIINELISNSLKYAFLETRGGKITVDLNCDGENKYSIIVSDNGIGFPECINYKDTKSLGLQLVNTLVGQLDGTITMENHIGTTFRILFAARSPKLRANSPSSNLHKIS
jgi:PAS domain S-box-containing protein